MLQADRRAASGMSSRCRELPFGGIAIDRTASRCRPRRSQTCLAADAVLLGAIGGPKWSAPQAKVRPEAGLLRLRKELGVYANLRPVSVHPELRSASSLKPEMIEGVDLMFVRELTGGIYFGAKTRDAHAGHRPVHLHGAGDRAHRARRRAHRAHAPPAAAVDRQVQRARDLAAVARGVRARDARRVPRRAARAHAGGLRRDAPDPPAARLRRRRHREHVRRHPDRRGLDAGRLAGAAAVGLARRRHARASTSRSTARRRISPARGSPIPMARSSASRCCCATRSSSSRRRVRSSSRCTARSAMACAHRTSAPPITALRPRVRPATRCSRLSANRGSARQAVVIARRHCEWSDILEPQETVFSHIRLPPWRDGKRQLEWVLPRWRCGSGAATARSRLRIMPSLYSSRLRTVSVAATPGMLRGSTMVLGWRRGLR